MHIIILEAVIANPLLFTSDAFCGTVHVIELDGDVQ